MAAAGRSPAPERAERAETLSDLAQGLREAAQDRLAAPAGRQPGGSSGWMPPGPTGNTRCQGDL